MTLFDALTGRGFTRTADGPLFEYAEQWAASNAALPVETQCDLFWDSFGARQYEQAGDILPQDD